MYKIFLHTQQGLLLKLRRRDIWQSLLIILPLMEVLPYLIMGYTYVDASELESYLYTNLLWSFFASVSLQGLISLQSLRGSKKLDLLFLLDGTPIYSIVGYALADALLYLISSLITSLILGLGFGYHISALACLSYAALSVPIAICIVFFIFGLELRFSNIFNLVNFALDIFQTISCVLFPMAALAPYQAISYISPLSWLNEYIRSNALSSLLVAASLSALLFAIALLWIHQSTKQFKMSGGWGR